MLLLYSAIAVAAWAVGTYYVWEMFGVIGFYAALFAPAIIAIPWALYSKRVEDRDIRDWYEGQHWTEVDLDTEHAKITKQQEEAEAVEVREQFRGSCLAAFLTNVARNTMMIPANNRRDKLNAIGKRRAATPGWREIKPTIRERRGYLKRRERR